MSIFGTQTPGALVYDNAAQQYDAILVMSFGGPEGMDDVIPFLENVAGRRNIPRQRLEEVAKHYYHFGGVSPLNAQNRALIAALEAELKAKGPHLPVYFGNRNWHPLITDTVRQMRDDGVKRALAFFTSAFSSYSSCRQYREDIIRARQEVGDGAPEFDKIRVFYNHPGFIEPMVEHTQQALTQFPLEQQADAHLVFTAHSIPLAMAKRSQYEAQLYESCRLVAEAIGHPSFNLVYQSRSGPPHIPWLEPDICDYLNQVKSEGIDNVVIVPIGFISDHMEVLFDLDTEARHLAEEIGLNIVRAETVGTHPRFVSMIRELILERMTINPKRPSMGKFAANHDICPVDCCLPG